MSRPERGAYGNKRGKTVAQRKAARAADKRAQDALAETRRQQAILDRRIEVAARLATEQTPIVIDFDPVSETVTLVAKAPIEDRWEAAQQKHQQELLVLREQMEKRAAWPLDQAQDLIRQGYTIAHVKKRTGWSATDLLVDGIHPDWYDE